jgi:hypothetical protein
MVQVTEEEVFAWIEAQDAHDSPLALALMPTLKELYTASKKFKPFNSSHEGFAVLLEEVDELWEEVKKNNLVGARREAIQVAAMALRFLIDCPPMEVTYGTPEGPRK